jgi:hypothetical protein
MALNIKLKLVLLIGEDLSLKRHAFFTIIFSQSQRFSNDFLKGFLKVF